MNVNESDAVLVGRILIGEAEAARILVERHARALRRLLARAGARPDDIDDLLQEIWIRVVRSASSYDPQQPFIRWLFAIAMNRLRTRWSRMREEVELTDCAAPHAGADVELVAQQRAAAVRAQIAKLPPHLADAILLRFFEDLSEKEIALHLGVPTGTVKSRLHNAIRKLRELYACIV